MALEDVARELFAYVLVGGLLSDYFDGVLARRLGVARPWLRRLDSSVDLVFYLFVLSATYVVEGDNLRAAALPMGILVATEVCCVGASLLKFGMLPATHTYSAKLYGLVIFLAFLGVLCFGLGPWVFWLACGFALLANGEVLSIILLSKEPPVDVPTVVRLLRRTS
jgi:phosphatidylglycerophosphate synthase